MSPDVFILLGAFGGYAFARRWYVTAALFGIMLALVYPSGT